VTSTRHRDHHSCGAVHTTTEYGRPRASREAAVSQPTNHVQGFAVLVKRNQRAKRAENIDSSDSPWQMARRSTIVSVDIQYLTLAFDSRFWTASQDHKVSRYRVGIPFRTIVALGNQPPSWIVLVAVGLLPCGVDLAAKYRHGKRTS
jgi:hypothetical protein